MTLFDPNRGRIAPPNLDDRAWSDIVSQAIALIPQYAPQWTDHGPSDIGITLVELFAWLVEGLTYRLNQVPDKNYVAFLDLLGITRDPPEPARAFLTFSATPNSAPVPKGTEAQTAGTETETPIVFETDQDLLVLPINLRAALRIGKLNAGAAYWNISTALTQPPAKGESLTIANGQSAQICLGFDAASAQTINLLIRPFAPLQPGHATVTWLYSSGALQPTAWQTLAVSPANDGTNGLQQEGVVQLNVPNAWASQAPPTWAAVPAATAGDAVTNAYFWIGLRVANLTASPLQLGVNWILFNAVSSYSALTIPTPENLGNGDGTPFQVFPLANGPLFARPNTDTPYDHLVVQVNGITWSQVDDFPSGAGNFYRVNPVTSEISFGNYDPLQAVGNGSMPGVNDAIVAVTYRYVAFGADANVGSGSVVTLRTPAPGITAVTNLFAAYGGADQENIDDTKRRAPQLLRNRYRAVTQEDYEFLAKEASTELFTVRCLAPFYDPVTNQPWQFGGINRSAGNVTVILVPNLGPDISPTPQATPELIHEVQAYLDRRRDITVRLAVTGPRYLPIQVQIAASAWQQAQTSGLIQGPGDVQTYINNRIAQYFHPVAGGLDGNGWQVGQNVFIADLYKFIMPPENIGFISSLQVQAGTPLYTPPNRPYGPPQFSAWVRLADYELVCAAPPIWLAPVTLV